MATINHKKYDEATETFKDFNVYDGKETLIFKVDGESGNVGIGTANPNTPLEVQGEIRSNDTGGYAALLASTALGYSILADTHTSGAMTIFTAGSEKMRITSSGLVGVGTNAPTANLTVGPNPVSQLSGIELFQLGRTGDAFMTITDGTARCIFGTTAGVPFVGAYSNSDFTFRTGNAECMRITSAGNVGIGTSSPPADTNLAVLGNFESGFYRNVTSGNRGYFLHLGANTASGTLTNAASLFGTLYSGDADGSLDIQIRSGGTLSTRVSVTPNGLTFNGDTAAANALDDYEEGTFTPTAIGGTTAGTTTYTAQNGYYTKIGRQVTVSLFVAYSALTGTGDLRIGGLPFTIGNLTENYPVGSIVVDGLNWGGGTFVQTIGVANTTFVWLAYMSDDASTGIQQCVDETATYRITMTYFV